MSSSSEFAAGPGAPAATEDRGGDEPEVSKVDTGFDDLRRESAAMLRILADRYDTESEDFRARSAQLVAESEAAGALAVQLADESVRIRTEADRLAAQPTWLSGVPDATAASKVEPKATTEAGTPGAATAGSGTTGGGTTGGGTAEPDSSAPPGPGPARGFAPNVGSSTEGGQLASAGSAPTSAAGSTSSALQGGNSGSAAPASPTDEPDDWAPRPFESWRNQASQVTHRLLEL
jgi:hypothetical protein